MRVRIYYEDTDCGGVVYYANYLKYFERARTHYLEDRGLPVSAFLDRGLEFRVTHAEVTYRSAARYGETLVIDTSLSVRRAALTFHHVVHEQHDHRLIVEGSATLVCVDERGKIARLPSALRELGLLGTQSACSPYRTDIAPS